MKKFFFFRSEKTNKEDWAEKAINKTSSHQFEDDLFRISSRDPSSKHQKHSSDIQNSNTGAGLRRSRSMSSASFAEEGIEQRYLHDHPSHRAITPEKKSRARRSSRSQNDASGSSSNCSSNVSSKIIDRFIDGEQNQDRTRPKNNVTRNQAGRESGSRPPRAQFTAPSSPTESSNIRPKSQSFREAKASRLNFTSSDWMENGLGHESPRRLAKNVIERLSQTTIDFPRKNSREFDHGGPITIEDIYGRSLNKGSSELIVARNSFRFDEPHEITSYEVSNNKCDAIDEEMDSELQRRYAEAEERAILYSEELEQDQFILGMSFDVSALIHRIRSLTEERMSLATEVSELLQSRIVERASAKEDLLLAQVEMELQTRRLERERKELQVGLEKELDRRSNDWTTRLEKYQFEEHRLRERVRELAEHNVSLQREVSSFGEREAESRSLLTYSEQQKKELSTKNEELTWQNEELHKHLSELQQKCTSAEENGECLKRNLQEKEKECKELHRSVTRLLRTATEQEKTIEGLRERFSEDADKHDKVDKLKMEQVRLTGAELALRRELESHRLEVEFLRRENISLLSRLKGISKDPRDLTFQLDNELWARVCCLQSQGLSLLKENTDLSSKLLALAKEKSYHEESKQDVAHGSRLALDSQFLIEADVKIQGFKRGTESLARSLQTVSGSLHEKATPPSTNQLGNEDTLRSELKAEMLVNGVLREKLYSKEMEAEQLHAELATAVRGNDILRYEVQNALDSLSCATHKMRELELQMRKKDEGMNRLQSDLQDSKRELNIIRGILPKVSEERDKMWEQVKDFSEKNMLLNSEVDLLKKKIDTLDEDILLKDGQITILKDSINKKSFDLLSSPDFTHEFLLE